MGLKEWFLENRLQSTERRLKTLHAEQKMLRKRLEELETEHRSGKVSAAEYRDRRARLEERRQSLVNAVREAEGREKALRAELDPPPA